MYNVGYIHHWIKQLSPVLIKIATQCLHLYDWPLKEITSAIESLVTKREKSFGSGRSCQPHKITVDYNYTVISEIFSWEVERKWTGEKNYLQYTLLISRIHFCSLLHAVRSFPKLVPFANLSFHLSSYLYCVREKICIFKDTYIN